ncbi:MAG: hypothetical protein ABT940_01040 [Alphaproteobacteria bacterium]
MADRFGDGAALRVAMVMALLSGATFLTGVTARAGEISPPPAATAPAAQTAAAQPAAAEPQPAGKQSVTEAVTGAVSHSYEAVSGAVSHSYETVSGAVSHSYDTVSGAVKSGASGLGLTSGDKTDHDLLEDRPSVVGVVGNSVLKGLSWSYGVLKAGVSYISPPSPTQSVSHYDSQNSSGLFKLLNVAGYKLKEVENGVGIIPTVSFKFAMVRELSNADLNYLDLQLEASQVKEPGLYAALQRSIVTTVMTINGGADYHVSQLKVQILPLPKVAFSVTPKATALGEDASALMRAIQKVDRRLRVQGEAQTTAIDKAARAQTAAVSAAVSEIASSRIVTTAPVVDAAVGAPVEDEIAMTSPVEKASPVELPLLIPAAVVLSGLAMLALVVQMLRGRPVATGVPLASVLAGLSGGVWVHYGVLKNAWQPEVAGIAVLVLAVLLFVVTMGSSSKTTDTPQQPVQAPPTST